MKSTQTACGRLTRPHTHLPLKLAVGPVPIGADGRGDVAAHAALREEVQRGELLVVQQGVAVVLVAHRHRGEELLAALGAGHAGAARGQVPPAGGDTSDTSCCELGAMLHTEMHV